MFFRKATDLFYSQQHVTAETLTPKPRDARCGQERVVERVLRNALHPALILDFRPKLGNRCRVLPVYALLRASILDFRPELGNQCKVFPVYALLRASILDFRAKLGNRCID